MQRSRPKLVRAPLLALALWIAAVPGIALAATPRTSLMSVENDVMCVVCRESLAVAQSPQAQQERAIVESLIAQGETKSQIERALVAQYGVAVLGKPPAHGFNLLVYILPPALLAIGAATLAITLPRWRRRTRAAAAGSGGTVPKLSAADARRLDEDLARFER